MAVVLVIGGLVLVGLPGLLAGRGRGLAPAEWARLCLVALGGGVVLVESGLILLAVPTVLAAAGLPGQGVVCRQLLESFAPMGGVFGWLLVAATVVLPARAGWRLVSLRRHGRAMVVEPWVGEHHRRDDHDLVVMPCAEMVACSVEGPPPQVVVSQGLVDALSPAELAVVVRHESAHLGHHHERLLRVGAAFEGFLGYLPWARSSASVLRTVLERCADEQAAGDTEPARAVLRAALLRVADVQLRPAVAGIARPDSLRERLDALRQAPATPGLGRRAVMYLPGTVVAAVVVGVVARWSPTIGPACLHVAKCLG